MAVSLYFASAAPQATYVNPTPQNGSTTNNDWVFVNATFSENLSVAYLEWGNSSGFTNVSMLNSSGAANWYKNMTGLADGAYNYTVYAQNTTGIWNQSARMFVTVEALPSITALSPPASNATYVQKWLWANLTLSRPGGWCGVSLNGTANQTLTNSTGKWWLNLSVPAEGMNNVTFFCNDTSGNAAQPQARYFTVDTIPPYSISDCQNLTIPGGYYVLAQNVSSAGTCFDIGADNVTLDGQGYTVNYSRSQVGHAVDDSPGYYNATIKNLIIANTSIAGSHAIYGVGMRNGTIRNNTMTVSASNAYGISLASSDANTIANNTITASGTSGHGIYMNFSSSNTISNNTIASGGYDGHGIFFNSSGSNVISNNNITISGSYGRGININSSASVSMYGNNITAVSVNYGTGIYVTGSNLTTISNNTVTVSESYNNGIYLFSSNSSTVSGNVVSVSGNSGSIGGGIYLISSVLNTVSDNNVTAGGDGPHGIRLQSNSNSNTVSRNAVVTTGNAYGINLDSSNSNTLLNNTVRALNFYGIAVVSSGSNNVTGGSIVSIATYDYFLQNAGTTNNFTDTNLTVQREVYFYDTASSFNYNNGTSGNVWLKTNVSAPNVLTRTLVNWGSALMKWNDTGGTAGITTTYNITGLSANAQYNVYNASNVSRTTPYNLTTDPDGNLPAFTIALDGNTEITVTRLILTITVQSPSNASYPQKWVWANITMSDPAGWCGVSLNGTANQTLSNSSTMAWWLNLSVPVQGQNNVTFYCNDTVGNMTQSAPLSFTIDTISPLIMLQSPSNTTYDQNLVWANLTLNETGSWCGASLNGGTNRTLTNSTGRWWVNFTSLAEGQNNVTFFCNDTAGNMNSSFVAFTVDTVPSITILSPPANSNYTQKWIWANLTLSESGSWCGVSLNGTANQTLANSTGKWWLNLSVPAEGQNNVTFFCNDTTGNMVQSATRNFTIDTANLLIIMQSPSNTTYSQNWVWANVSLSEPGNWCGASLNGGTNQTLANSTGKWWLNLSVPATGINNVTFFCNDTAGNMNSSFVAFTTDVPPSISILSPPANSNYTQKWIWANVSLSESGSWCGVSLNGTANQTLANSTGKWWLNLSVPAEGMNNVTFHCNDTTGNMVQSAVRNFTIDATPPSITFAGQTPNNEVVNRSYAYINLTSSETLSVALLEWNGTVNQTMQGSGTAWYLNKTGLSNGNYTFRVYANDTLDNLNSTEQRWVYINSTNTTSYAYNFTLGNSTGGTISNVTLRVYTDTADVLSDFTFNSSTPSAGLNLSLGNKYHVEYALPGGVVLAIKNLTINSTTTISPQFVDSYAGSLPSATTAKSYVIALNDSTLSYGYAELTLPVNGTVNRVLHCTAWNFTSAACSGWESYALSTYSYRLNSTHLVFNVTYFDAYMAGYYEAAAAPTPTLAPSTPLTSGGSGGGSGGAGSGVQATISGNATINAKTSGPFSFLKATIDESVIDPEIRVTTLHEVAAEVVQPAGFVYAYAEISANFDSARYLRQAGMGFSVNKSWYSSNGISPASTKLLRYTGSYWQSLPTVIQGEDETAYSFSANASAFSLFAVTGTRAKALAGPSPATTAPPAASPAPSASPEPTPAPRTTVTYNASFSFLPGLAFLAVIIAAVLRTRRQPPVKTDAKEMLHGLKEKMRPGKDAPKKEPENVEIG